MAIAQVFFTGARLDTRVEAHSKNGRSDLEVFSGERVWIFEFKVAKNEANASELLKTAVVQLQKYGTQYLNKEVIRMALVYSTKSKKFSQWSASQQYQ